jgi:hypothetical protein
MAKRKTTTIGNLPVVNSPAIDHAIRIVRGHKVLLDEQLAGFYGVPTGVLVQAVKRSIERFPDDFMFQLSRGEWTALRSQIVILKTGRGHHRKYLPYAFTEQGVAMLSGVLRSRRAAEVNIQIMRAFVRLRQLLAAHRDLGDRLAKLEERMRRREHAVDRQFDEVFRLLDELFDPPDPPHKPIGFHTELEDPQSNAKRPNRR